MLGDSGSLTLSAAAMLVGAAAIMGTVSCGNDGDGAGTANDAPDSDAAALSGTGETEGCRHYVGDNPTREQFESQLADYALTATRQDSSQTAETTQELQAQILWDFHAEDPETGARSPSEFFALMPAGAAAEITTWQCTVMPSAQDLAGPGMLGPGVDPAEKAASLRNIPSVCFSPTWSRAVFSKAGCCRASRSPRTPRRRRVRSAWKP